jgi:16S rRNA (cytosine1402-N4)-methyltransferase
MDELPHKRRPRYSGKYPRRFEQKYKEHLPERFSETFRKVLDSGKTPAGSHRPILVEEVLQILAPQPGELSVDCTLGYGGHTHAVLSKLLPGGRLIGLDQDPIELPRTEARLRAAGFGPEVFSAQQSNFAGLAQVLGRLGVGAADLVLADLGVSSMQLDDPKRGFSLKHDGPLDMRMNPNKGCTASKLIQAMTPHKLTELLAENADETCAELLGRAIAGHSFATTRDLVGKIRSTLPRLNRDDLELSIRRTFQALRIAVNDEFSALDSLLRQLPACLKPGGRVAILTFHSGEDRRVKKAFASGLQQGLYAEIAREVIRPSSAERHANPRSAPAKLRWARAAMSLPR